MTCRAAEALAGRCSHSPALCTPYSLENFALAGRCNLVDDDGLSGDDGGDEWREERVAADDGRLALAVAEAKYGDFVMTENGLLSADGT